MVTSIREWRMERMCIGNSGNWQYSHIGNISPKSHVRYRLLLAIWSRGAICPVPHERVCTVQGTCGKDEILAHKRAGIWYHIRRQFKNRCILCIGWHCWNLRNFIVCAKRGGECTQLGACLSRGSHRAFSGPQQDTGKECALFLFPYSKRGHWWKTEWQE